MAWDSGTYRRDASKANRGKPFEDFINFANEKYQAKGIAVMHKVPTEFIPLRGAHGQVANCKVERNAELVPDIMRAERQGRGNAPVPDFARCIYRTGKEECRRNCTRKLCRKAHLLQ